MARGKEDADALPQLSDQREDKPGMELEHAIGYSYLSGGLYYHPDGKHLVYAAGGAVVIIDFNDPHSQQILTGHDGMITCIALGNTGRWVHEPET